MQLQYIKPLISKFTLYSFRGYGQPKLTKPIKLKGIKQFFSIEYIVNKCRCPVYITENDVWVKHRDYFSNTYIPNMDELGKPLSYFAEKFKSNKKVKKFIYSDTWGAMVLRNEAWICLEGIMVDINSNTFLLNIRDSIVEQQELMHGFGRYELCCSDMERFWEKLVVKLKNYSCNM